MKKQILETVIMYVIAILIVMKMQILETIIKITVLIVAIMQILETVIGWLDDKIYIITNIATQSECLFSVVLTKPPKQILGYRWFYSMIFMVIVTKKEAKVSLLNRNNYILLIHVI